MRGWLKYVGWVLLVIVCVLWVRRETLLSERSKQSADLLAGVRDSVTTLDSLLNDTQTLLAAAQERVDTHFITRTVYVQRADDYRDNADDAIVLVPSSDSLACPALWNAYENRTSECAALREVVKADSIALRNAQGSISLANTQLLTAGRTITDLRADLVRLSRPYQCKILPFLSCPSRTASFFVGAGLGVAGTLFIKSK